MARKTKKTGKARKTKWSLGKLLRMRRSIATLVIVILCLLGYISPDVRNSVAQVVPFEILGVADPHKPLSSRVRGPIAEGLWRVVHVVDGDTIDVGDRTGRYRIRLIGVDTPETKHPTKPEEPFGREASEFTRRQIALANHRVRLAFDGDLVDRYNRTLAMVYLQMPNGTEIWLNELLIREGLGIAETQYRYSRGAKDAFRAAENAAKAERRNIWSLPQ